MLSLEEFTTGSLSEAEPLALVLPRTRYEETLVIGRSNNKRIAVFISGDHRFHYFPYDSNDSWAGLIVKHVKIEVDEGTAFDPSYESPLGSLVRRDTRLCINGCNEQNFGRVYPVSLIEGIEAISERYQVGFVRWQIVIGQGIDKRVLSTVDVRDKQDLNIATSAP